MILHSRLILPALAAVLLATMPGQAADYDPPIVVDEAPEFVPVEVGSGWYLRGDVGYSVNKPYDYFQVPPGFTSSESPVSASVGMGYHFTDYFRGELNFGLLPTSKFSDDFLTTCEGTQTVTVTNPDGSSTVASGRRNRDCEASNAGSNKAYNMMANAFVDLGTYSGFTPFIGGGVGVAYSTYRLAAGSRNCVDQSSTVGNTTTIFECDDPSVYEGGVTSERQYNFAYSLGAGVNYRFSRNASVDLGYEYFAVPQAKYVSLDGTGAPVINEGIDYHQVKLGLRYDLW
jgi:opacity protein-like surface antigen